MRKEPLAVGPGELSGDKDGKDTSDFAEFGVTNDCFLDLERPLLGLCSLLDICEDFRSRRPSLLVSIPNQAGSGNYSIEMYSVEVEVQRMAAILI